jgi:hypothetical protein
MLRLLRRQQLRVARTRAGAARPGVAARTRYRAKRRGSDSRVGRSSGAGGLCGSATGIVKALRCKPELGPQRAREHFERSINGSDTAFSFVKRAGVPLGLVARDARSDSLLRGRPVCLHLGQTRAGSDGKRHCSHAQQTRRRKPGTDGAGRRSLRKALQTGHGRRALRSRCGGSRRRRRHDCGVDCELRVAVSAALTPARCYGAGAGRTRGYRLNRGRRNGRERRRRRDENGRKVGVGLWGRKYSAKERACGGIIKHLHSSHACGQQRQHRGKVKLIDTQAGGRRAALRSATQRRQRWAVRRRPTSNRHIAQQLARLEQRVVQRQRWQRCGGHSRRVGRRLR